MSQTDVDRVVAKLLEKPSYIQSGSGLLAKLFNCSQEDAKKAKKIAKPKVPNPRKDGRYVSGFYKVPNVDEAVAANYITALEEEVVRKVDNVKGTMESHITVDYEPKGDAQLARLHRVDTSKYRIALYWSKLKSSGKFTSSVMCSLIRQDDAQMQKQVLLDEIRSYSMPVPRIHYLSTPKNGCLLEISIPDLHIGKLAHRSETGEDYDSSIAVERFKDAIKEIVSRVNLQSVSRIHLPIGNDLINIDNEAGMTTGGTPQNCDTRFSKMVQTTRKLLVDTINELSVIAPVDVTVVRGNHDSQTSFMIGEILDAWFHNNPNVTIDNSPRWRKYYEFGNNSFLLVHGDKEKHGELGLIFATEEPELWGRTRHRFAKLGHLHKSKQTNWVSVDTLQGFQVNILPSLSGTDSWHASKGYMSLKQAKGFLYHPEQGEIAQYTYTV